MPIRNVLIDDPDFATPCFVLVVVAAPMSVNLETHFKNLTLARHLEFQKRHTESDVSKLRTVGLLVNVTDDEPHAPFGTTLAVLEGPMAVTEDEQEYLEKAHEWKQPNSGPKHG